MSIFQVFFHDNLTVDVRSIELKKFTENDLRDVKANNFVQFRASTLIKRREELFLDSWWVYKRPSFVHAPMSKLWVCTSPEQKREKISSVVNNSERFVTKGRGVFLSIFIMTQFSAGARGSHIYIHTQHIERDWWSICWVLVQQPLLRPPKIDGRPQSVWHFCLKYHTKCVYIDHRPRREKKNANIISAGVRPGEEKIFSRGARASALRLSPPW